MDEKVEELQRNIPIIVERCVMAIKELLTGRGYEIFREGESLRVEFGTEPPETGG
jgi:hypothetical protein